MPLAQAATAAFASLLSGCSSSFAPTTLNTPSSANSVVQGRVHGGQQPVVGAKVYLYAAGTGGYGTASQSLLSSTGSNTKSDGTNYYVTTDANGFFSINGDYTCPAGGNSYLYLYSVGGNAGGGVNPNATFMAALGPCAAGGTLATAVPYVWMNEITTVVAAYSLAGWMTSPLQLATDNTTAANNGLAAAFTTATLLENISTGTAYSTVPGLIGADSGVGSGGGTAPQAKINSLANILAACVNTKGASASACSGLFSNALTGGTTTPSDTATAVLNIAHNLPNLYSNATAIFNLSTATAPYQPALTTGPNDWTLSRVLVNPYFDYPPTSAIVAFDGVGNVGFSTTASGQGSINIFNAAGTFLSGVESGDSIYGLAFNTSDDYVLAIDQQSDGDLRQLGLANEDDYQYDCAFVINDPGGLSPLPSFTAFEFASGGSLWALAPSTNSIYKFPGGLSGCSSLTSYTTSVKTPVDLAADASGNIWVANQGAGNLLKVVGASGATTAYSNAAFTGIAHVAVGSAGEVVTTGTGNVLTTLSTSGSVTPECNGAAKIALTIDGADARWILNGSNQLEFCAAGASEAGTLYPPIATAASSIAVDTAGNVWVLGSTITEVIGVATPTTLPLATAAATGKIGTRP